MKRCSLGWALLLFATSCGGVDEETSRAWGSAFADFVLPGATSFRGEAEDSDNGRFMFSYLPPIGELPSTQRLAQRLQERDRCMQVMLSSPRELWMRCSKPRLQPLMVQDVRVLQNDESGRLFVMCVDDVSGEQAAWYPIYVESFRSLAKRRD